jgi:hypothetical protein
MALRTHARTHTGICHTFAGSALDRSRTIELKDPTAFEDALRQPGSSFVLFHGTAALVKLPAAAGAAGAAPAVNFLKTDDLERQLGISVEVGFGGRGAGQGGSLKTPNHQWLFVYSV